MGALLPFTSTLHLRGDRLISQGSQRRRVTICRASLRISYSNPASTCVEFAAEVRNREISAKHEQQLSSQGNEDTHQSRPRAAKAAALAATKTEDVMEGEWDVYCDILPNSCECETQLQLTSSWPIGEADEKTSQLMELGSRKNLRLSTASLDLFD